MVKSSDRESAMVAPFLIKCYDMVDDITTDGIISWGGNGNSFIIWNTTEFSVQLLPKFFKHSNFSSFIRQLNIYGFRKIDTDRWEFSNDGFIKGEKSSLKRIARRKHPSSGESRRSEEHEISVESSAKSEGDFLWAEIGNLKTDKNELMQDLVSLKQTQEATEKNLNWVRTRIQGMEKNLQQMLSLLVMVMQNPNFLVQLLHPKENSWRMAEPGSIVEISNLPKAIENLEERAHVEEVKDAGFSPELMKALMDDNFPSLDSLGSFILPELSEERAWEQLLLCSPIENSKEGDGSETDMFGDDYESLDFFKGFDVPTDTIKDSMNGASE